MALWGTKNIEFYLIWPCQYQEKERFAVTSIMILLALLAAAFLILYLVGEKDDRASGSFAPFTALIITPSLTVVAAAGADGLSRTTFALMAGIFTSLLIWKATKTTVDWLRPFMLMLAIVMLAVIVALGTVKQNQKNQRPRFEIIIK